MNKSRRKLFVGIIFVIYLIMLVYFMFFAEVLGRSVTSESYNYNLIPFKEISRFILYSDILGMKAVAANLLGNVIAFVPFGLFLPGILNNRFGYIGMFFLSLDLSLVIEISQLVSKVGSFDVDDLILNTVGGVLGYMIYRILRKFYKRNESLHEQGKI